MGTETKTDPTKNIELLKKTINKVEEKIKEQEAGKESDVPVESVKVAAPSTLILDGKITEKEQRRLQALIGTGKSDNIKVFAGKTGEKLKLTEDHVKASQTIVFADCN